VTVIPMEMPVITVLLLPMRTRMILMVMESGMHAILTVFKYPPLVNGV
jgi:hypothetical protein